MGPVLAEDLRYLLRCYRSAGVWSRIHVVVRRILCPFDAVVEVIPACGKHLDVGCGSGILLALLRGRSAKQELCGVDASAEKIEQAHLARIEGARFGKGIGEVRGELFESVSLLDVLYLLEEGEQDRIVEVCSSALRQGGLLVVKEVERSTGWRHCVATAQEILAVRVLRITMESEVAFIETGRFADLLRNNGFDSISTRRVDRGYLHRHVLFTARKRRDEDR